MKKKRISKTPIKRTSAPTRPEDVFGSLHYAGRPKTLKQMAAGITKEAKRRFRAYQA
jgi:hypothetical protein